MNRCLGVRRGASWVRQRVDPMLSRLSRSTSDHRHSGQECPLLLAEPVRRTDARVWRDTPTHHGARRLVELVHNHQHGARLLNYEAHAQRQSGSAVARHASAANSSGPAPALALAAGPRAPYRSIKRFASSVGMAALELGLASPRATKAPPAAPTLDAALQVSARHTTPCAAGIACWKASWTGSSRQPPARVRIEERMPRTRCNNTAAAWVRGCLAARDTDHICSDKAQWFASYAIRLRRA